MIQMLCLQFRGALVIAIFCSAVLVGQERSTPSLIINSMLYPGKEEASISTGLFDCGQWNRFESTHASNVATVAALTDSASADIERALLKAMIEQEGPSPSMFGLRSVLVGYSRGRGARATSLLGEIERRSDPGVKSALSFTLNEAWAAALDVTAVVARDQQCTRRLTCSRSDQVIEILRTLICGLWQRNEELIKIYSSQANFQGVSWPVSSRSTRYSDLSRIGFRVSFNDGGSSQRVGMDTGASSGDNSRSSHQLEAVDVILTTPEGETCDRVSVNVVETATRAGLSSRMRVTWPSVNELATALGVCGVSAQ